MKKSLLALALSATSLVALPAFAQDSSSTAAASGNYLPNQPIGSGNWFVDLNVGRTDGKSDGGFGGNGGSFNFLRGEKGRRTGYGLTGGYRWKVGNDLALGAELGYTDLGNFRVKNVFNDNNVNQRTTTDALRGWLLGVNGRINLMPQWYLGARGGYFHGNDNHNNYNNSLGQNLGLSSGGNSGRGGFYAGIGTGWDINEHFGVGVHYDYFKVSTGKIKDNATGVETSDLKRSTGIVSLNGEYRF